MLMLDGNRFHFSCAKTASEQCACAAQQKINNKMCDCAHWKIYFALIVEPFHCPSKSIYRKQPVIHTVSVYFSRRYNGARANTNDVFTKNTYFYISHWHAFGAADAVTFVVCV